MDSTIALKQNAVSLIESLNPEDVQRVVTFAIELLETSESPYRPISEAQMAEDLALSREQIANEQFQDFDEALDEISEALVI